MGSSCRRVINIRLGVPLFHYNLIEIIMPHLIPNLFEKAYTPYTAKLAPKNLWSRPALGKYYYNVIGGCT